MIELNAYGFFNEEHDFKVCIKFKDSVYELMKIHNTETWIGSVYLTKIKRVKPLSDEQVYHIKAINYLDDLSKQDFEDRIYFHARQTIYEGYIETEALEEILKNMINNANITFGEDCCGCSKKQPE